MNSPAHTFLRFRNRLHISRIIKIPFLSIQNHVILFQHVFSVGHVHYTKFTTTYSVQYKLYYSVITSQLSNRLQPFSAAEKVQIMNILRTADVFNGLQWFGVTDEASLMPFVAPAL